MTPQPNWQSIDSYESWLLAVRKLRWRYLASRQWVYEQGRWESAEEWLERRDG